MHDLGTMIKDRKNGGPMPGPADLGPAGRSGVRRKRRTLPSRRDL
jgi:hypothetical protein